MRLILITTIILILTITSWKANAQVKIDTVDISETVLEDRHLRYMYNFVLNNTFFQYRSGIYHIGNPDLFKNKHQNDNVIIVNHKFPIKIDDLEFFIRPDTLIEIICVNNFDHPMENAGLISQFDFEYLNIDFETSEDFYHQINQKVFESPNSRYVVQFSTILIRDNHIYLSINITFPVNYNPDFPFGISQLYEFEWCESVGWVYPKRLSDSFFGFYQFKKGRLGGTIEIPSLKCYPVEK